MSSAPTSASSLSSRAFPPKALYPPKGPNWVHEVKCDGYANDVAEASKEGGFLGFGGVAVSDTEKATLSEIANVLGRAERAGS